MRPRDKRGCGLNVFRRGVRTLIGAGVHLQTSELG